MYACAQPKACPAIPGWICSPPMQTQKQCSVSTLKHHLFSLGSRLGAALSHAPLWPPNQWADRRKQKGMLLACGAACWQQLPHSHTLKIKHCKSVTALRFSLIQLKTNQYKLWTGAFFLTYIALEDKNLYTTDQILPLNPPTEIPAKYRTKYLHLCLETDASMRLHSIFL